MRAVEEPDGQLELLVCRHRSQNPTVAEETHEWLGVVEVESKLPQRERAGGLKFTTIRGFQTGSSAIEYDGIEEVPPWQLNGCTHIVVSVEALEHMSHTSNLVHHSQELVGLVMGVVGQ